jgi:hypothetical protein
MVFITTSSFHRLRYKLMILRLISYRYHKASLLSEAFKCAILWIHQLILSIARGVLECFCKVFNSFGYFSFHLSVLSFLAHIHHNFQKITFFRQHCDLRWPILPHSINVSLSNLFEQSISHCFLGVFQVFDRDKNVAKGFFYNLIKKFSILWDNHFII